ncbi:MAG: Clp protease N-terminal domain-containing protein, partial [Bacteroidales bacterium]|nr:Clp protease N-terminal domain-containing protein [Bacteroidales bacterium]
MNFNQLTIKAQEAVQKAVEVAKQKQHQAIETPHLLLGLMDVANDVLEFLINKAGSNTAALTPELNRLLSTYPKVLDAEPYLASESNRILQKAIELSQKDGNEFVSIEYILLGISSEKNALTPLFKQLGLTVPILSAAIQELRKGQKVNSPSAEETYNALNKYAINLNDRARTGKLDPVIGRDEEIRRVLQILSRRT